MLFILLSSLLSPSQTFHRPLGNVFVFLSEVGRSLDHMYAIHAGLEPEGFIELFPYWVVQEDITEIQLDVSY